MTRVRGEGVEGALTGVKTGWEAQGATNWRTARGRATADLEFRGL